MIMSTITPTPTLTPRQKAKKAKVTTTSTPTPTKTKEKKSVVVSKPVSTQKPTPTPLILASNTTTHPRIGSSDVRVVEMVNPDFRDGLHSPVLLLQWLVAAMTLIVVVILYCIHLVITRYREYNSDLSFHSVERYKKQVRV
jgi:hypothetical protein